RFSFHRRRWIFGGSRKKPNGVGLYSVGRPLRAGSLHPRNRLDRETALNPSAHPLKARLGLLRRLGIRYLSARPVSLAPGAAPAVPEEKKIPEPPLAVPAEGGTGEKKVAAPSSWNTGSKDSTKAMELTAFYQDIHECQNCPL